MEELLKEILSEIKSLKDGQLQTNKRLDRIETTMATKEELAKLDAKIEKYGKIQQQDIYRLLELMNNKLDTIREDFKSVAEVTGDHEIRIRTLARRPV